MITADQALRFKMATSIAKADAIFKGEEIIPLLDKMLPRARHALSHLPHRFGYRRQKIEAPTLKFHKQISLSAVLTYPLKYDELVMHGATMNC